MLQGPIYYWHPIMAVGICLALLLSATVTKSVYWLPANNLHTVKLLANNMLLISALDKFANKLFGVCSVKWLKMAGVIRKPGIRRHSSPLIRNLFSRTLFRAALQYSNYLPHNWLIFFLKRGASTCLNQHSSTDSGNESVGGFQAEWMPLQCWKASQVTNLSCL